MQDLKPHYRVIIVGGGINGVGIARDCALRGIECLLVEKNDFSAGTSGSSSGMIHGGARYILHDPQVTKLACVDSGYIQQVAPHLLFRIPFLFTVYHDTKQGPTAAKLKLEAVETFFEIYDRYVPFKNGKKHTRLTPKDVVGLEPNIPPANLVGGVTFDEWGIDVPRLCIANAVDAFENGATILNHTAIISVIKEGACVKGVQLRDELTGDTRSVTCDLLINATGPWSEEFGKMLGVPIKIRGGKGIHISFDRRLFNMAIVSQCIDGREIFVLPYENETVLGTTDDDYFGDLNQQDCTQAEIDYLLDGIRSVFPAIDQARMVRAWSGVRPTIAKRGVYEDNLSREHEIYDHKTRDSLEGVISLVGGKLASYRIMAQETVDLIAKHLDVNEPCTTHQKLLPGADSIPDVTTLAADYQVDAYTVSRLVYRHGSRATRILDQIQKDPTLGQLICPCEPVTAAEMSYVMQNEFTQTLSDLRRRTRFSIGPCQGMQCTLPAGALFEKLKPETENNAQPEWSRFMQEWWWNRAMVLQGDQIKQEELAQALHYCNASLSF